MAVPSRGGPRKAEEKDAVAERDAEKGRGARVFVSLSSCL